MVAHEALETVCIGSNSHLTQWLSSLSITSSSCMVHSSMVKCPQIPQTLYTGTTAVCGAIFSNRPLANPDATLGSYSVSTWLQWRAKSDQKVSVRLWASRMGVQPERLPAAGVASLLNQASAVRPLKEMDGFYAVLSALMLIVWK